MRTSFLFALLAASPSTDTARFDLVCVGTRQDSLNGPIVADTSKLIVDLENKLWCWDTCETTFSIVSVMPDRIVLQDIREETPRHNELTRTEVNRTTGVLSGISIETRPFPTYIKQDATCKKASFSGFPKAKF